jgi:hypothetical protein
MFLLFGLIVGVLGASIILLLKNDEAEGKITAFIICATIYSLISWWIFWGALPSIAWPLFGWYSGLLTIWWIISAFVVMFMKGDSGELGWSHVVWFPICAALIIIIRLMSGAPIFGNADDYSKLIGPINEKTQKHWSQEIQPLDQTKIRLVPRELALSSAKTALSKDGATLGSQFPLDTNSITLQKIRGDYWYLIPLDFKGYKVWTNADSVPGYVKINAVDPYAKPILVSNKKMKYTQRACFGYNLERRLYKKFYNKILRDYSFEEDDESNVFWVITVCKPTISYWGLVVEGIIIYNPENGDYEYVLKREIEENKKYSWVDRVTPSEIAQKYVDYWGEFKDGWWNAHWKHINLLEAETPTMNYSSEDRCILVIPITSTNDKDQAMTGLMYCDSRTGNFTYYTTSGGASEEAIVKAVNDQCKFKNWHANKQIVYENVYGKLAALVPVLGANGNYQGLGIVENENKRVAFGVSPQEAIVEFQKIIMNSGGQISTETVKDVIEYTGIIVRIGWDISNSGKQYYLYFNDFKNSFMISSESQSELALTKEGDKVLIQFINSNQMAVPTISFKNLTLNLESSASEKSVKQQIMQRQEKNQTELDIKDFKEKVKDMGDGELKELMDSKK